MKLSAQIVIVLASTVLLLSSASAQRTGADTAANMRLGDGPRAHEFWPAAPDVGDLFPDVTVADDTGNPVNIRELAAENYSVLVLGCLT